MPTRGRGGGMGGGGFDKSTTTFVAPVTNKTRRHSSNCHYDSLINKQLTEGGDARVDGHLDAGAYALPLAVEEVVRGAYPVVEVGALVLEVQGRGEARGDWLRVPFNPLSSCV